MVRLVPEVAAELARQFEGLPALEDVGERERAHAGPPTPDNAACTCAQHCSVVLQRAGSWVHILHTGQSL